MLDLTLARGLDYYTGPVFEAKVIEPKIGSVAGGGRYEGLIGSFGSRPISATGVSLGLERIIEVVREHETMPIPTAVAQVFVPVIDRNLGLAAGADPGVARGRHQDRPFTARRQEPG